METLPDSCFPSHRNTIDLYACYLFTRNLYTALYKKKYHQPPGRLVGGPRTRFVEIGGLGTLKGT